MLKLLTRALPLFIFSISCSSSVQPEERDAGNPRQSYLPSQSSGSSGTLVLSASEVSPEETADSQVSHENGKTTILAHDNTSATIVVDDKDGDGIYETKTLAYYWEGGSKVTRGGFNKDYEWADASKEFQVCLRFIVGESDLLGKIDKVHLKCNQFDGGDDIDGRAVIYTSPVTDWHFRPRPDNPDSFLVDLPEGLFPINEEHGDYTSYLDLAGRAELEETFSFDVSKIITGPGVYTLILTYDETRYSAYGNSLKLINRFNPEYLDAVDKLPRIEISYNQSTSVRVPY